MEDLRECSRAAMAVDKALGEAIRGAIAAGAEWKDTGRVLGVTEAARSKYDVIDALAATGVKYVPASGLPRGPQATPPAATCTPRCF